MNADILKRVVRAIAAGSLTDLDRLADKMVETERKTGHGKLADQLEAILKQPRKPVNGHSRKTDSDSEPDGTAAQPPARGVACHAALASIA